MLFLERDGRKLRVSANGTDGNELFHAALPGLVHQLHAHHQVVIEELGGLGHVGADAAHVRRQMDEDIRRGVFQHARDIIRFHQVVVFIFGDENILSAFCAQVGN